MLTLDNLRLADMDIGEATSHLDSVRTTPMLVQQHTLRSRLRSEANKIVHDFALKCMR